MNEILDNEIESQPGQERSRKACKYFIADIFCLIGLLIVMHFFRGNLEESVPGNIFMALILVFIALGLLGFRNAILSVIKKEKWSYIKIVGVLGNFIFFGIILLLFVANVLDIVRFMI